MSTRPSQFVSKAGFGRQGYCRLCSFSESRQLNEKIRAGWNARQVEDWMEQNYGVGFTRQTFYNHKKKHLTRPEDQLVTAVERTKRSGQLLPRAASTEQFLEAVRDVGYQRAIDNPDEVTIDHALKASQILQSSKKGDGGVINALILIMTGDGSSPAPDTIEGTAREVSVQ